jgi:uncharacterized membrane protein HdeD (DUF308 family)
LKINYYVAFGVSVIMLMMGILFLVYPFPETSYLSENNFIRYMFGGLLIVYGIFRGFNAYSRLKNRNKKLHYYDPGAEDE